MLDISKTILNAAKFAGYERSLYPLQADSYVELFLYFCLTIVSCYFSPPLDKSCYLTPPTSFPENESC